MGMTEILLNFPTFTETRFLFPCEKCNLFKEKVGPLTYFHLWENEVPRWLGR